MDLGWKRLIPLTLAWLLLVASVVTWHWRGLIMIPVVAAAAVLLVRATRLGSHRTEQELVLPSVGRRVSPVQRPVLDPTHGVDA
jgi:hypothetical protein